jgi:membrane protein YfhO
VNASPSPRTRRRKKSTDSEPQPRRDSKVQKAAQAFPALLLAFLTMIFFWFILFPFAGKSYWLWEDFLYQNYPYRVFAATSLAQGTFPFWNPYVFGGVPFFADIQTAVLYPFNLVQVFFTDAKSLSAYLVELIVLLHYFLAALFTYRFLKLCRLKTEAALLGGVTFAFSGFMVTHVIHTNFISVFVWLPLILELFERALSSRKIRFVLLCALVLALSTLGGYPQYSLYINYVLVLYWLIFELIRYREQSHFPVAAASWRLALLVFICLVGVGLNASGYLSAAELAQYTPRSTMTYQASIEHSIAPWQLVKLICPGFFGTQYPGSNTYWAGGYSAFWETCLFVGVLPIILAVWGVARGWKSRHVAFATALAFFSLWLALGGYGLLYKLFFHFAPGFNRFRIPGRFSAFASFALALLAAHGWSLMMESEPNGRDRSSSKGLLYIAGIALAVVVISLACLKMGLLQGLIGGRVSREVILDTGRRACYLSLAWIIAACVLISVAGKFKGRLSGSWLGLAAIVFVFVELYVFGTPFLKGPVSPDRLYPRNEMVRKLQREGEQELFRINARDLKHTGIMLLRRNQGSVHRLFLIEGYNPLQLKRRLGDVETERRFDLFNVKYRIKTDLERQTAGFALHPGYLPRAFMMHRWRIIEDDAAILATINSPEFDHRREVVLEQSPGIDMPLETGQIESKVEIINYSPNEVLLSVQTDRDGIVVLSEWHYPAWKAWLDGEEVPVLRADYALRAVAVTQGVHKIRFAYSSKMFNLGLLISALTILTAGAVAVVARKRGVW